MVLQIVMKIIMSNGVLSVVLFSMDDENTLSMKHKEGG